jgi:hypothetical protein
MAASGTDKITDIRNAARPNSARATGTRSSGGTSLACDNLTGWPTASKVHFVTYQIDSASNPVAGTQLDCSGIVSGNTIGSFTVIDGNDTGNSINDVVEMLPTAAWGQDLADALTNQHTRTGAHTGITTDSLTVTSGTTLPAGDIGTADIASAAITAAKMQYGLIRNRQGGTTGDGSWATTGSSNTDTSATGVFIQSGSVALTGDGVDFTITFPVAYNQIPVVFASSNTTSSTNSYCAINTVTTTSFKIRHLTGGSGATETGVWLAIGQ